MMNGAERFAQQSDADASSLGRQPCEGGEAKGQPAPEDHKWKWADNRSESQNMSSLSGIPSPLRLLDRLVCVLLLLLIVKP